MTPQNWHTATQKYSTHLAAAGRSPGTVRLHMHYLSLLQRTPTTPANPWATTVDDLSAFLSRRDWSPETRKSARSVMRGFFRWAHARGWVDRDPATTLAAVAVPPPRPRPTPEHLVEMLVRRPDRIGLMALLGARAGLRAAEIAQVHRTHYTGGRRSGDLVVLGKGGKTRVVPVESPELATRLWRVEGWAFPNGRGSHLSPGHVTRLISRALPDDWTAHTLRHRMATRAYAGTRDLLAVGEVLGHSRPETTQRYVLLPDDARRAAVAAAG
ncbi:tyrosine-type recombinase/integrase [Nocardioides yefusunii]|uniref:Tyrosine-type recombinase/integrase n=1 Tax=Nocardioides yefusunii TaxID=2500546 RepID=A0ABW1QX68_9ACTN|nr:tyrosine-type recombinase/integrase [Nocardioides yefusunii]